MYAIRSYYVITNYYFQLFLAVTVITMALTPLSMHFSSGLANVLLKLPLPKWVVDGMFPLKEVDIPGLKDHVVIIGKDESAIHLAYLVNQSDNEAVSIVFDPIVAHDLIEKEMNVVYGDAMNEPILKKAHVEDAAIIIVSVGDPLPAMAIIEKIRSFNGKCRIIVRTPYTQNAATVITSYSIHYTKLYDLKKSKANSSFSRITSSAPNS